MKIHELGHIVLYVTNLELLANFYRDILGFHEVHRGRGTALFSSGRTHHELLLIEVGGTPKRHGMEPGLYHIGFKVGNSHEDIQAAYTELLEKHVQIVGVGDHTVTHSIYVLDPDGNELELYADVSDEWKSNPLAVMMPVKPLHLE